MSSSTTSTEATNETPVLESGAVCRDPRGTFPQCPMCESVDGWQPEHAHFRCRACGFRDSCCD